MRNVVLFRLLLFTDLDYKNANIITLIIVKLVAYICNKNFVFKTKCESTFELIKEFGRFFIARGATMLIDYFALILFVEELRCDKVLSKVVIIVFVIVLNYSIGKKHVFKKNS